MGVSEDRYCSCKSNSPRLGNSSHQREAPHEATIVAATNVSNRNGAHAHRDRIFLRRRYQIFVDETLQQPASPHESRCEARDSQRDSIRNQTPSRLLSASLTACGLA